jgi:hypothetical protein
MSALGLGLLLMGVSYIWHGQDMQRLGATRNILSSNARGVASVQESVGCHTKQHRRTT